MRAATLGLVAMLALPATRGGAATAPPKAPALRLDVTLPVTRVTVGDRVEALLTLRVPTDALADLPRFPVWKDSWGEAEILEQGKVEKVADSGGTTVFRQRLVLAGWEPGRIALPPVAAAVPLKGAPGALRAPDTPGATAPAASPDHLYFSVAPVLPPVKPGERAPEPKPAAPALPLPWGLPFMVTTAALAAACLGVGYLLRRRSRARVETVPAVLLPPYEELLAGLDGLSAEPSALQLHTRLSLALRTFFGRTLGFPATQSTTAEIDRRLRVRLLPAPLVRRAVELLRACDLVKFAREESALERSRERLAAAREIAQGLNQHLTPPPVPEDETRLRKAG